MNHQRNIKEKEGDFILVPKDDVFDLLGLFDFVTPALISEMMTKNSAIMHIPYFHENLSKKGFFVQTANNKARIVLGRELDPSIYRGQCRDYGNLTPKYLRFDNEVERCIEFIKREEFKILFKQTAYYKIFSKMQILGYNFEFDLDAIAQHYHFATNYLDITRDIRVAMFFAYTDCKNGVYFPIEKFGTNDYNPILYIGNYAHLEMDNILTTVGFQMAKRPQEQLAMALDIKKQISYEHYFRKVQLPPDRDIAYGFFKNFNNGKDLFPEEPLKDLELQVKRNKILDINLFEKYCKVNKINHKELQNNIPSEFKIDINDFKIESSILNKMNEEDLNQTLTWIKENISYRKIKRPKANEEYMYMDMFPQNI